MSDRRNIPPLAVGLLERHQDRRPLVQALPALGRAEDTNSHRIETCGLGILTPVAIEPRTGILEFQIGRGPSGTLHRQKPEKADLKPQHREDIQSLSPGTKGRRFA